MRPLAGAAARRYLRCPLVEALDLAAGVDDALLAGEEGVAGGADLGLELLAHRPGRERVSAHAGDDRVFVESGMDLGSHDWVLRTRDSSLTARVSRDRTGAGCAPGR